MTIAVVVALALLAGLLAGAWGVWWVIQPQLTYLCDELRVAQDRLLHAWRDDHAVIPPRPTVVTPLPPLDPVLLEAVNEWEDPESRAAQESRIRTWLAAGWTPMRILRELEEART